MRIRLLLGLTSVLVALAWIAPQRAQAADPWWTAAGFGGQRVTAVTVTPDGIHVTTAAGSFFSHDAGVSWHPQKLPAALPAPEGSWVLSGGRAAQMQHGKPHLDPLSPDLGTGGLITAPAALDGVVVAVDSASVVWMRQRSGDWARALLLLPDHLGTGSPRVTTLTAFTTSPLTSAIYLGTDGYGVLVSQDGGADWIRFGSGLPDHVTAAATDAVGANVFVATDSGLFVHHLQASPAPPDYRDAAYWWRVLGMALVSLLASAAGAFALGAALRRPAAVGGADPRPYHQRP